MKRNIEPLMINGRPRQRSATAILVETTGAGIVGLCGYPQLPHAMAGGKNGSCRHQFAAYPLPPATFIDCQESDIAVAFPDFQSHHPFDTIIVDIHKDMVGHTGAE